MNTTQNIAKLFTVPSPWEHQLAGVGEVIRRLSAGSTSICLTSPTGSGKTACAIALTNWALNRGDKVLIITNRILLTQQTRRVFEAAGVSVGVISASMPQYEYERCRVQIATMQTILSRVRKDKDYWIDADMVLVDEVHMQANGQSAAMIQEYEAKGAAVIGITATPLGLSNVCRELVVAGRTRDLQDQGILCCALWFAPSELDTRKFVKGKVDLSITENQARRTWGPLRGDDAIRTRIVGNIIYWHRRIHPELDHTVAFAPGVKESVWAAEYYSTHGIRALHVDGQDFWCDGRNYDRRRDETLFQQYMDEWRQGLIDVVFNRYVLREGIDEPLIRHIIIATPVGSFRSFLQMVGRGLRTSEITPHTITVTDHGGCWWRHGSANANQDWEDVFDCANPDAISLNRINRIKETREDVGTPCPKCGMIHTNLKGRLIVCQFCGEEFRRGKLSRPILQADGTLTLVNGSPIKPWRIRREPGDAKLWAGLYWNAMRNGHEDVSFNQLYYQFYYLTAVRAGSKRAPAFWKAHHPVRSLPLMPEAMNDWHLKVRDVPRDRLYR